MLTLIMGKKEPLDEFEIINRYIKPVSAGSVILGRGDDCSVVDLGNGRLQIETTDCLVEDIHFRRRDFHFSELAYKSLVVNLSDIAAMGGDPLRAHLNLALPKDVSEDNIREFFTAFYALADPMGVALVGGDLSSSPGPIFVNLHIVGEVSVDKIQWRHSLGKPGVLCVTGPLGDSSAGFYCLENQIENKNLIHAHKKPPLELLKGQWLSEQAGVQGMMDLSDGLCSDLQRIKKGSVQIQVEKVPMSLDLLEFSKKNEIDPLRWALSGGEDYRLLVNCREEEFLEISEGFAQKFGATLFAIGDVSDSKTSNLIFLKDNAPFSVNWTPFKHF